MSNWLRPTHAADGAALLLAIGIDLNLHRLGLEICDPTEHEHRFGGIHDEGRKGSRAL